MALIIGVVMLIPLLSESIRTAVFKSAFEKSYIKLGAMSVGMVVYMILHELVHGIFNEKNSAVLSLNTVLPDFMPMPEVLLILTENIILL